MLPKQVRLRVDHADNLEFVEMHPDPNAPDTAYLDFDKNIGWQITLPENQSEFGESEMYGDPGSVAPSEMLLEQMGEDAGGEEAESGSDEDGLMMSDDDGEEDDGDGQDGEEDEESAEKRAKARQLASEIKALEGAIEKKKAGFQGGNPIMMVRIFSFRNATY